MPQLDDVVRAAKSLEPDDRLRLIAKLWESLPRDHWAAPSDFQLAQFRRHFEDPDADPVYDPLRGVPRRVQQFGPDVEQAKLYHATRRFDLATIFVAMAVYSVLLALMGLLHFQPASKVYLGIFVVVVGLGQVFLEPYYDARRASVITGAAFHALCSLIYWVMISSHSPASFIGIVVMLGVGCGAAMGYMAGALVGGIYLIADVIRGKFGQSSEDNSNTDALGEATLTSLHPLENAGTSGP